MQSTPWSLHWAQKHHFSHGGHPTALHTSHLLHTAFDKSSPLINTPPLNIKQLPTAENALRRCARSNKPRSTDDECPLRSNNSQGPPLIQPSSEAAFISPTLAAILRIQYASIPQIC
nr:expressed protein [Hymenolepis microstoma]CUU97705.1 hypothetical transcript [Hymenolepis microstoma]